MKYIHNGKTYIIFTVFEGIGHADTAMCLESFDTKHAGFLVFKNDEPTKKALVYGNSTGLKLEAAPFEYDEINYVGISPADFIMISNSSEALKKLGCRDIEVAIWKESREGNDGECPVIYPGHSALNMKACKLLKH